MQRDEILRRLRRGVEFLDAQTDNSKPTIRRIVDALKCGLDHKGGPEKYYQENKDKLGSGARMIMAFIVQALATGGNLTSAALHAQDSYIEKYAPETPKIGGLFLAFQVIGSIYKVEPDCISTMTATKFLLSSFRQFDEGLDAFYVLLAQFVLP